MARGAQALVQTNYTVRASAFLYCFAVIGVVFWERDAGLVAWTMLALQFLAYPHVAYWRAIVSPHPTRAELDNLFLDAALLGVWCAELGFPTWITYVLLSATTINAVVNRGAQGLAWSLVCSVAGAVLWTQVRGLNYRPETSDLVTALCLVGALGYVCTVGYVVYAQNRRLAAARDALRASEERYRLIAENAADLIGMVDRDGKWLYASPSYDRVLASADLKPGSDAFQRAHPDDAEHARMTVARVSGTGNARDIPLRLVDRDGRIRQYKTRVQAVAGKEGGARRMLLVSQDVTDLRDSEEKLLLAAHAFEGMTEAIVITAADGTIVTVNRAFAELTGYTRDDVLGQPEHTIRNALQSPDYYDEVFKTVARDGYWSGTTWARRKNGSVYREWRSVRAVRDANGAVTHLVMVFYEVGVPRAQGEAASKTP